MSKKIILIAGPTASGKSSLALLLAKKIKGEIVNADSMQVYKEFSVLSSRPNEKDLKTVNHHIYAIVSVNKNFSTGKWLNLIKKKIKNIIKRKKVPILVGGTGLYFTAITKGISEIPSINNKLRLKLRNLHKKIGQKEFYRKLVKIDPISKNKISSNDIQRTLRAYEVKLSTKKSLYDWASNTKSDFSDYEIKKIFLDIPRDILLKKIKERTNQMFERDCIKEVKSFLKLNIDKSLSANKIIGVAEITHYLSDLSSIDRTKELINIKTRQYAKRQKTWCRGHMKNWNMLYYEDKSVLLKKVLKLTS